MKNTMNTMNDDVIDSARYKSDGYKDRADYLASLVKDFGVDMSAVSMIAEMLGPSEDFDGLVNALEDFADMGL
jgi:hypothetical protein